MARRLTGRRSAAITVLVMLASSGCGAASSPDTPSSDSTASADVSEATASASTPPVLAELCRAQKRPAQTDERFAEVHGPLHELADEVQQQDRPAAADLLEAKRAVEDALAEPEAARSGLTDRLERLVSAVRDALGALDRPAPPCDIHSSTR